MPRMGDKAIEEVASQILSAALSKPKIPSIVSTRITTVNGKDVRIVRESAQFTETHRLSVEERKLRRERNQARRRKAAEGLAARRKGRAAWLRREKLMRPLERNG